MPRHGASPKKRSLRLGKPEARIFALFGPPKRRSALPRHSLSPPKHTCKPCFGSSLPLILTIIHWINEDPNK